MLGILILSSVIIFFTSTLQYKEEAKDYNIKRLERKEKALKESIRIILRNTTYPVTTDNIPLIFKEQIHEIANIHNLNFEFYDLDGHLLISSAPMFGKDTMMHMIPVEILDKLARTPGKRITVEENTVTGNMISSYSYVNDLKFKPIAILHIPYKKKSDFYQSELKEFLYRLAKIYLFLIIIAIFVSYWLSKNITKSLTVISDRLKSTDIEAKNQKIKVKRLPEELMPLIDSYNQMVDKLEKSTRHLIKMEKEAAWGEMARQIAHEIKNPLTPMRLSIEHFLQTYRPGDPDNEEKIRQFSEMMLEQVEVLNRIAQSFSDYTRISDLDLQRDNLVETVRNTVMLFPGHAVFESPEEEIYIFYDKTRIKQALTNLLRNAIQAADDDRFLRVRVKLYRMGNRVFIEVEDNGTGIPEDILKHIFEPKFTTKSKGTGLGLSIVKRIIESHGGDILVETYQDKGTKFILILPVKTDKDEV
jgi:signal transduction histidine kinase